MILPALMLLAELPSQASIDAMAQPYIAPLRNCVIDKSFELDDRVSDAANIAEAVVLSACVRERTAMQQALGAMMNRIWGELTPDERRQKVNRAMNGIYQTLKAIAMRSVLESRKH